MRRVLFVYVFSICLAFGQDVADQVRKIQYPLLARQVRIQGDVRFYLGSVSIMPVSGHPLLVPVAMKNLEAIKDWVKTEGAEVNVVYYFRLMGPIIKVTSSLVEKGDAFDRFMIRLANQATFRVFKLKTSRMVQESSCEADPNIPANRLDQYGNPVEIWVYSWVPCINTERALAVASR